MRAIEFRHRKTVLKSCLTAVQVPELPMHAGHVAESYSKRRATAALARGRGPDRRWPDIQSRGRQSSLPPSLVDVGRFAGLYTYRQGDSFTSRRSPPPLCCAKSGARSWTMGTLQQNQRRSRHAVRRLCVPTVIHEGIQADVRFIQLESEPTPQSRDRRRTGHYRRGAGVGSASNAVYTRFSSRSCGE
jgi:hypothetical protein